jgi:hypothetical protein
MHEQAGYLVHARVRRVVGEVKAVAVEVEVMHLLTVVAAVRPVVCLARTCIQYMSYILKHARMLAYGCGTKRLEDCMRLTNSLVGLPKQALVHPVPDEASLRKEFRPGTRGAWSRSSNPR